jgi:hypothetical protein
MTIEDTQRRHEQLVKRFAPNGSTIYSVVRKVAASGMSRNIDFYAIQDDRLVFLSGYISTITGYPRTAQGIKVKGAGMDMCFAVVYDLASRLYGDGYALKSETI